MRTTAGSCNRAGTRLSARFTVMALLSIAACSDRASPTALTSSPPVSPPVPVTPVLTSMQVTPGSATLYHGESISLDVILRDQTGEEIGHADSTIFVSSSSAVATVDARGVITAAGLGQTSITVSATLQGSTKITVVPITVVRLVGRLAFSYTSSPSIPTQIYTASPDGTDVEQVTMGPANAGHPSWSPDGTRIVFDRWDSRAMLGIYVVNAHGSNPVEIVAGGNSPTWLRDGRIAFSCPEGVCVTGANGAGTRTLIPNVAPPDAADGDFTWSPDGSKVAFTRTSDLDGDPWQQVYVMNADGSGAHRLTSGPVSQWQQMTPRWSPDGTQILFVSTAYGVSIVNADGSNFHFISAYGGVSARPDWSPDGSHIVIGTELDHFFIANAGTTVVQIVHTSLAQGANAPYGEQWSWSSR